MNSDQATARLAAPVTKRDHVRGLADAPIQLVEYGDYECPNCGRAYWVIRLLQEEFGDSLTVIFRNFPVSDLHPRAHGVAQALEAAAAQDHFWEMHDRCYENQHELEELDLERHADSVGLDVERWKKDMNDVRVSDRVREDIATGRASGVTGTPTFFINDALYEGPHDLDSMRGAIHGVSR